MMKTRVAADPICDLHFLGLCAFSQLKVEGADLRFLVKHDSMHKLYLAGIV